MGTAEGCQKGTPEEAKELEVGDQETRGTSQSASITEPNIKLPFLSFIVHTV
jgi:hypothetical protein